ncbi:MAG: N-acetylmuramidase family protein [Chitinispirillia bacterium]|nr:N-acetylmuramidase family protein [Chitinispirillia bacterium]MCL2268909.1 N-acetylmuramidase family protein [Chitinispirillia bacterium]
MLKAIGKKESRGTGFHKSGHAIILFERHKMYKHLKAKNCSAAELNKLTETYPNIVNKESGGYNVSSYEKLKTAREIDYDCAVKSCSWGCFQVMGEYYGWLYSSPAELDLAMCSCELQQFNYFVAYLEKSSAQMIPALKNRDWKKIATLYNGSGWVTMNKSYPVDIEKYYKQFKAAGV